MVKDHAPQVHYTVQS